MKAFVDKDVCIGCGLCTDLCPEVFSMDDDGTATAIDEEISEDTEDAAREAAEQCPVGAIKIDEED
ncbi:ferredoxin [Thermoclostridium stercorarium subsp. stercorarium DSM 8532]|uniref:Ferredoxin n=3 Tax=Thermoclostridium stercorarium TaxID=1510 RepID=L7VKP3_THES1|nr:ferredoxin [Thermoclostridium stercorarium]AGC68685.1 ferredoxin [Thermoclostridium stercorarium subsp. stercorarium DSM 8532]AGI39695.1 Fdx [Thermoclostridium stercorarium subsp. stercorarium DSM 8532]ANW99021.1 ferredoxin [Thermoclostridium stercorarium subsp. thermolacticum DSM 2910]ANX01549.1 ferredoxin [Thermoclostridium stercorarium subsp. leptospartum DSM 9219]UZQ84665.1 ferredoxin [Thermoclostridium stercorarium]